MRSRWGLGAIVVVAVLLVAAAAWMLLGPTQLRTSWGAGVPPTGQATRTGDPRDFDHVQPLVIHGRSPDFAAPEWIFVGRPVGGVGSGEGASSRAGAAAATATAFAGGVPSGPIGVIEAPEVRVPARPAGPETADPRRQGVRGGARMERASVGDLGSAAIRRALGGERPRLESCYWEARSEFPTLAGDATFVLTVKPAGEVQVDVDRTTPSLAESGVTACIKSRLESLDFRRTPPRGGDVRLRVPMTFVEPTLAP
ncbi:MAG: AgmX/PglI C-terminal domain-containing protein [Deltaproteobacteria bacterium]|nr:AgmX/PglI C-terminal domain-containing protein [Deltaproteobacteria bacterium]